MRVFCCKCGCVIWLPLRATHSLFVGNWVNCPHCGEPNSFTGATDGAGEFHHYAGRLVDELLREKDPAGAVRAALEYLQGQQAVNSTSVVDGLRSNPATKWLPKALQGASPSVLDWKKIVKILFFVLSSVGVLNNIADTLTLPNKVAEITHEIEQIWQSLSTASPPARQPTGAPPPEPSRPLGPRSTGSGSNPMRDSTHCGAGDELEVAECTRVIDSPGALPEYRARALHRRASAFVRAGDHGRALADLNAAIGMGGVPRAVRQRARVLRGQVYKLERRFTEAMDDLNTVIGGARADPEVKAAAIVSRGVLHGIRGDGGAEAADFTMVIEMGASAGGEARAQALLNRGNCYNEAGRTQLALDDYGLLIGEAGLPILEKLKARMERAGILCDYGLARDALADCDAVIGEPTCPPPLRDLARATKRHTEELRAAGDPRDQASAT
jgi:tetratricopeptide (TPR) repeat protein